MVQSSKPKRLPSIKLYMACLAAQMGSVLLGCALGWSGSALADMGRSDSRPHLTNSAEDADTKSWIGSSMTLGALFGGIIGGFSIEIIGRRKTLLFLGAPYTAGWLLLCLGRQVWLLILGRVVTGLCTGAVLGAVPTFVAEISPPSVRGLFGMTFNLGGTVGILLMNILSLWVPWEYLGYGAIVPSVLLSGAMFFIPESPNWLMVKYGRCLRVVEALHQLRHRESDIDDELAELEAQVTALKAQKDSGFSAKMLRRQDVYKPLTIGLLLCFFQQFSGTNAVQFYMTGIFADAGSSLRPEYAVIVVNTSMFVATLIGSTLVDRLGRKILLMASGTGHTVSLAVLGYYYYKNRDLAHPDSSPLPIICMAVFFVAYSIGYSSVTWIVITEICNSSYVGFITSTCSVFVWITAFVVTKEFEDLIRLVHKYGAYWFFAGLCLLSTLFIFYLPETKGQSIEEIQRKLCPKVYRDRLTTAPAGDRKDPSGDRSAFKYERELSKYDEISNI